MINIFDGKPVQGKGADKPGPYLSRLQQLVKEAENGKATTVEETSGDDASPSGHSASKAGETGQSVDVGPSGPQDFSGNSRGLAEQIAPKFVEALSSVFDEVRQMAMESNRKVQSAMLYMAKISARMESLSNEFGAVRQRADSAVIAERELDSRLARLDEHLGEYERLFLSLQEQVRQMEQRLERQQSVLKDRVNELAAEVSQASERLASAERSASEIPVLGSRIQENRELFESRLARQADAIRGLHDTVSAQSGRQEELRIALQRLGEADAPGGSPKPLPENL